MQCGITSGGGFAGSAPPLQAVYKRPSWQDEQVQEYLNNNGPYTFPGFPDEFTVGYNSQGRAFPDLAAYANWYPIISYSGEVSAVAGTSLSAPLTAGLITLVNQALLEQGYEKVGYMNPMLYWMAKFCPEAFNDIMFGNNQEDESGNKCAYGFNAAPGWDVSRDPDIFPLARF
jgi:tripeptidyl-peptidase-1